MPNQRSEDATERKLGNAFSKIPAEIKNHLLPPIQEDRGRLEEQRIVQEVTDWKNRHEVCMPSQNSEDPTERKLYKDFKKAARRN